MAPDDPEAIARAVLASLDGRRQMEPLTGAMPDFSSERAYAVTQRLRALRNARGENTVGRKIGFTNRGIWPEYGVYAPIWGDMFDTTVHDIGAGESVRVSHLPEPRIEPEIVLGLERDLSPDMSLGDISSAIGWVAHGFEIVQSIYPGWRFRIEDCVANGGLHGKLCVGPRSAVPLQDRLHLAERLASLKVVLSRNGMEVDRGVGANALGGPVQALSHLVQVLGRDPLNPPLRAGEMVTTGTLTRAFPLAAGENWSTTIEGFGLPGLSVHTV
jgi:2-keto-4-pentenoate hydratase